MISIVFAVIIILYLLLIIWLWMGWEKLPMPAIEDNEGVGFSIVIAVRNEMNTIGRLLEDIDKQTYTSDFEVIIINDHSEDLTLQVIEEKKKSFHLAVQVYELKEEQGKKAALKLGIEMARFQNIVTTDGDCRVSKDWLQSMASCFSSKIKMVVGPVALAHQGSIWSQMQSVEFASLVGSGAATLGWDKATMCNGANLAFRKESFEKVGGYTDNAGFASGDDVFLMHKFAKHWDDSIMFCKRQEAIVLTNPAAGFEEFFEQRKRWAGKWSGYNHLFTLLLGLFIYVSQLSIIIGVVAVLMNWLSLTFFLELAVAKLIFEFLFLKQILNFFKIKMNSIVFLLLQASYPIYVVVVGLTGLLGNTNWKNRNI